MPDRKKEESSLSSELEYILDVNKKAVEIHVEVAKQNEDIIESLEEIKDIASEIADKQRDHANATSTGLGSVEDNSEILEIIAEKVKGTYDLTKEIDKNVKEIDKNFFRLVLVLGSISLGTLITLIQAFLHK